jgi:hypothetical protein
MTDSTAMLVDEIVMHHIGWKGSIKSADPYIQYLVKTSDHPLLRFRRHWIRATALRQALEAAPEQRKMGQQLAQMPARRGELMRQTGIIHPHYAEDMRRRHNASLNDPDFLKFVKREEPAMFPPRQAV